MSELLLFGKPIDVYVAEREEISNIKYSNFAKASSDKQISNRNQTQNSKFKILFSGLPRPAGYTNNWLDLMDDKWLLKKKFMENGLPVPLGGSASSFSEAKKIFYEISNQFQPTHLVSFRGQVHPQHEESLIFSKLRDPSAVAKAMADKSDALGMTRKQLTPEPYQFKIPVIIKPRSGSRGRHSSTFVYNEDDLRRAFKIAKQLCRWVIVEQQLFGPVYRATVIGGNLAGVLRGDPPQVLGDGVYTIEQLVVIKNAAPHPGVKDIIIDLGVRTFLSRQNLSLETVCAAGQTVLLSEKIGVNYGGSSSEDFEICHPDNKELFLRAAAVLGDPLVGFDFIIPDITKSYKEQLCGFIEVNSLPFINLHHDPLLGTPRNAAGLVWDMMGW
jgi:hypothetical protein